MLYREVEQEIKRHSASLEQIKSKRPFAEMSIRSKLMGHPAKKTLGDFESDESWVIGYVSPGTTCVFDNTFSYSGKQSVKVVIPAGGYANIGKTITPIDFTKKEVGMMVYQTNRNFATQVTFRTSPDGGTTTNVWQTPYNATIKDKWYNYDFIPPSGASLTSQNWVGVRVYNNGAETQTVWLDLITLNDKPTYFTNGAVTFIFDGGYNSAIANGKPILDKYGYKGVSSINASTVGNGQASIPTLKQMQSSGWDICMHSTADGKAIINGVPYNENYNLVYNQIMTNKDLLDSNGLRKGSRFVIYYQGKYTEYTTDILEDYCGGIGRGATSGLNSFLQHDAINVRGTMIYTNKSTASLKTMVDEAKALNLWIVFFVHKVDEITVNPANDTSIAQFKEMVDYVNAQGLRVVTYSQMYDDILFRY